MAGFKLSINVAPKDIPYLDDAHKRDCADAITNAVNSTLKYTLIMSGAIMALFAVYSYFRFIWMLRMGSMLPDVSAFVPIFAVVIFIFEFISGTMKKWALILQLLFHFGLIFASVTSFASIAVVPFAIYGAALHFKLISLLPWHDVISWQPGYPEFTSLPGKDEISLPKKDEDTEKQEEASEEKDVPAENQDVTDEKQEEVPEEKDMSAENQDVTSEKQEEASDEKGTSDEKQETVHKQESTNKPAGGSGKKKQKRKKRKK